MRSIPLCVVLLGAIMLPATLPAAEPSMKEGLWEISSTMEMPGMPFKPPPTTVTHCYSKEDVQNEQRALPQQQDDCKITDMQRSGGKVSWKVSCNGKNPGKGEGEIVFKGNTAYEGTMKFELENMKMTTRYEAKRIGDCK